MANKQKIHWEEFEGLLTRLERKLEPVKFNFKNIYGIPRGGLIPALMLSYRLDLPLILDKRNITDKTLIVDDIADTGETLQKLLKGKEYGAIATVWYHPQSKVVPLYYVEIKGDTWLIFPWETALTSKRDGTPT